MNTRGWYVGGEWLSADRERIEVVNPATEEPFASVPSCTPADVDDAVAAAGAVFPVWSALAPAQRAAGLRRLLAALSERRDEIARTVSLEVGTPHPVSAALQADLPLRVLSSYVEIAGRPDDDELIGNSRIVHDPVGVVGAITPWNFPLHQVVAKVAPALAAGCTVVLKPSELAPLTAYILAECVAAAGLPPGVFNLVPGTGPVVGEALAAHPAVDMLSFTGSTRAGVRVSELAAATVKRVSLELGGKSANVVLPGADLHRAVRTGVANAFLNAGQTCYGWTRLLLHQDEYEEGLAVAAQSASRYPLGDPFTEGVRMGPLISAAQRDRCRGLIEAGVDEGCRLVIGGPTPPDHPPRGYFVRPTVLADADSSMRVAQEEIFGPVLTVLPYASEEEALRIANDTPYGLGGAVWAATDEQAVRLARGMRTGQVDINGGRFNPLAPFGGYKRSGNGRELGTYGLREFQETKAMQLPTTT